MTDQYLRDYAGLLRHLAEPMKHDKKPGDKGTCSGAGGCTKCQMLRKADDVDRAADNPVPPIPLEVLNL